MRISVLFALLLAASSYGAEEVTTADLPLLSAKLTDGKTYRGFLDAKTNSDRLWLRFGEAAQIRRGVEWKSVLEVKSGEQEIGRDDLLRLAENARQSEPATTDLVRTITIPPSPNSVPIRPRMALKTDRIADVQFDVLLGNWDSDVEADGLLIQLVPVNAFGATVVATGTLTVELFVNYRIDQDAAPHGRGTSLRALGRWTTRVDTSNTQTTDPWIRLPFQASHPEFDTNWAPYGLVHVEFAAIGEGVFHRSIDGIRIRPWAPLRDHLERKTGTRFLPIELQ